MDKETIDQIAEVAIEKILERLPEVIGNLMSHHAMLNKMNSEFYRKYPEFADNKDLVVKVLEAVEGNNPGLAYEQILEKSVPEIKRKLGTIKDLDITKVPRKEDLDLKFTDNSGNGII